MTNTAVLAAIDEEIHRLQSARALLVNASAAPAKRGPGRPRKNAAPVAAPVKRTLSAEARAKIAQAQKKRWAAAKKVTK